MEAHLWAMMSIAELLLFILGGFCFFRSRGNTLAEAGGYAVICSFMLLSFIYQSAFLSNLPVIAPVLEFCSAAAALFMLYRKRNLCSEARGRMSVFIKERPISSALLVIAWSYLAVQAYLLPPNLEPWPYLDLLAAVGNGGEPVTTKTTVAALPPLNSLILCRLFLRNPTRLGIGLLGFTGYLSIAFCTYALARRYAWVPLAFTVTLVAVGFPRLVLHATTPGAEIIPAAGGVFCLLVLYRLAEQPSAHDLTLLILGIFFCLWDGRLCFAFPAVAAVLSCMVLFPRHGAAYWVHLISSRKRNWILPMPAILLFSQGWVFLINVLNGAPWVGSTPPFHMPPSTGGLIGAVDNLFRYLIESAELPRPIEILFREFTGWSPLVWMEHIYHLVVSWVPSDPEACIPFHLTWFPDERLSWFGPLGFLLVLPSVVYGLFRGPRRLKTTMLGLSAYFLLIALVGEWHPENVSYFSVFFACGAFSTAFLLPPWRLTERRRALFKVLCFLLLFYACLCNSAKPVVGMRPLGSSVRALLRGDLKASGQNLDAAWRQSIWYRYCHDILPHRDPVSKEVSSSPQIGRRLESPAYER